MTSGKSVALVQSISVPFEHRVSRTPCGRGAVFDPLRNACSNSSIFTCVDYCGAWLRVTRPAHGTHSSRQHKPLHRTELKSTVQSRAAPSTIIYLVPLLFHPLLLLIHLVMLNGLSLLNFIRIFHFSMKLTFHKNTCSQSMLV